MGAPPDTVANRPSRFSSLAISILPTFSTATCTSAMGRPKRVIPFSIMRAEGESVS